MATTIIPKTKTPLSVILTLLVMSTALGIFLNFLIGIWGIIILFVFLAFSTSLYTEGGVPAFHALILVNSITGEMRAVFPGLNPKLPWEDAQKDGNKKKYIDLRTELSDVCNETYASKTTLMETRYIYTLKIDLSGDNPGENVVKYSNFEPDMIKRNGRSLFSMLLSDYYGKEEGEELLNKAKINQSVFGSEENKTSDLLKFEKKHAVKVSVRLEDSDRDKASQKFRDMISGAESIGESIEKLTAKGMERSEAEKIVKLLNTEGYTEKGLNLNVDAPDLKNLQHVSILGTGNNTDKDKKKGK